jgi:hypothetical protein
MEEKQVDVVDVVSVQGEYKAKQPTTDRYWINLASFAIYGFLIGLGLILAILIAENIISWAIATYNPIL